MTQCTLFLIAFSPCSTNSCHRSPQDSCCALGPGLSQGQPGQLQQPRAEQTPLGQGPWLQGFPHGRDRGKARMGTALLPGLTSQGGKTSKLAGIL